MGQVANWKQYFDNVFDNNPVLDFGGQVIEQVSDKVCSLYQKYPNSWLLSPLHKALLESVCAPPGKLPPAPPPPDFEGGQCVGKGYRVFWNQKARNIGNCAIVTDTNGSTDVIGAVQGMFFEDYPGTQVSTSKCRTGVNESVRSQRLIIKCTNQDYQIALGLFRSDEGGDYYSSATILNIETLDGSPDDCGNLPPTLPPDPPKDPGDFNQFITINNYTQEGDLNNTFNVPLIFNENNLTIPLEFDLGGNEFTFGDDGINTPEPDFNPPGANDNDFEVNNPTVPPDADTDEEGGSDRGEDEVDPETTEEFFVATRITTLPLESKAILQTFPEDSDFFAGYLVWTIKHEGDTYSSFPVPIRKIRQFFIPPDQALGYRYYTIYDARIRSFTFIKPKLQEAAE